MDVQRKLSSVEQHTRTNEAHLANALEDIADKMAAAEET